MGHIFEAIFGPVFLFTHFDSLEMGILVGHVKVAIQNEAQPSASCYQAGGRSRIRVREQRDLLIKQPIISYVPAGSSFNIVSFGWSFRL